MYGVLDGGVNITNNNLKGLWRFAVLLGFANPAKAFDAMWPAEDRSATPLTQIRAGVSHAAGVVPPFRLAQRQLNRIEVQGGWRPASAVSLGFHLDARQQRSSLGEFTQGPGDLTLEAWTQPVAPFGVGWRVKLPNASDDLGTDETDVEVFGTLGHQVGSIHLSGAGGLAILGDPLQLANQDDAAFVYVSAKTRRDWGAVALRGGGTFASARNPARHDVGVRGSTGCRWVVGFDAAVGVTAAAPDTSLRLWFGSQSGCLQTVNEG